MKKILTAILATVMLFGTFSLTSCGNDDENPTTPNNGQVSGEVEDGSTDDTEDTGDGSTDDTEDNPTEDTGGNEAEGDEPIISGQPGELPILPL